MMGNTPSSSPELPLHHHLMDKVEAALVGAAIAVTLLVMVAMVVMAGASFGWGEIVADALRSAAGWEAPSRMGG